MFVHSGGSDHSAHSAAEVFLLQVSGHEGDEFLVRDLAVLVQVSLCNDLIKVVRLEETKQVVVGHEHALQLFLGDCT